MHQPTERAAVSAVAAYNLAVELDGLGSFELQEANLLDECKWCFDTADSLAHKHLSATHPLTLAFYNPTVTDSSGRDGPARRVRLGRTVLGQKVDGSTYAVGWPHFTLMELKEVPKRQIYRSRSGSPPPSPYLSPQPSSALPTPLPPAPEPPSAPYFSQAHLLPGRWPEAREPNKAHTGPPVATVINKPSWGAPSSGQHVQAAHAERGTRITHNRPTSAKTFLGGGTLDKESYKEQTSVINPSYNTQMPASSGARLGTGGSRD